MCASDIVMSIMYIFRPLPIIRFCLVCKCSQNVKPPSAARYHLPPIPSCAYRRRPLIRCIHEHHKLFGLCNTFVTTRVHEPQSRQHIMSECMMYGLDARNSIDTVRTQIHTQCSSVGSSPAEIKFSCHSWHHETVL